MKNNSLTELSDLIVFGGHIYERYLVTFSEFSYVFTKPYEYPLPLILVKVANVVAVPGIGIEVTHVYKCLVMNGNYYIILPWVMGSQIQNQHHANQAI